MPIDFCDYAIHVAHNLHVYIHGNLYLAVLDMDYSYMSVFIIITQICIYAVIITDVFYCKRNLLACYVR